MIEVLSFLIPLIIGAIVKNARENRLMMVDMAVQNRLSRESAFERSNVSDGCMFTKAWRVPVRPVITYIGIGAFYSLPFIPLFFPEAQVHIEVCDNVSGLWSWFTTGTGEFCEYKTLSGGIMWTKAHTNVVLAVSGYWFGSR